MPDAMILRLLELVTFRRDLYEEEQEGGVGQKYISSRAEIKKYRVQIGKPLAKDSFAAGKSWLCIGRGRLWAHSVKVYHWSSVESRLVRRAQTGPGEASTSMRIHRSRLKYKYKWNKKKYTNTKTNTSCVFLFLPAFVLLSSPSSFSCCWRTNCFMKFCPIVSLIQPFGFDIWQISSYNMNPYIVGFKQSHILYIPFLKFWKLSISKILPPIKTFSDWQNKPGWPSPGLIFYLKVI